MPVGLVVVSHVAEIAEGVRRLVAQMAPDVTVAAAGGTDDGGVGTSFDLVLAGIERADDGAGVAVLCDLGSAVLTSETALELLDDPQRERVRVVDAPLVEGAVAASVAAQGGADLAAVVAAAAGPAATPPVPGPPAASGEELHDDLLLVNRLGLHARPAARLATDLAPYDATVVIETADGRRADARSVLGVVALALRGGDRLVVRAGGPEAPAAMRLLRRLVADGFGETDGDEPPPGEDPPVAAPEDDPTVLRGRPASGGLAVGPLVVLDAALPDVRQRQATDVEAELHRLRAAVGSARRTLSGPDAGPLSEAHLALLADPALVGAAERSARGGSAAEPAWWSAVLHARDGLAASGDEVVRGRAADVLDVGLRVLAALDASLVGPAGARPSEVRGAVVAARDLLPSQVPGLAAAGAAAVVTVGGAPTGHAAILARGLGLPMVVGVDGRLLEPGGAGTGRQVLLDASAGVLRLRPSEDDLADARDAVRRAAAEREEERRTAQHPVVLRSGRRVVVAANVGSVAEAGSARASGADAVGLLRTELLFLDRRQVPDEDEQTAALAAVLAGLGDLPVVVRTLDIGGDKALPAFGLDPVRHGFLGQRGLRYFLAHRELLRPHLRAILRAGATREGGALAVMAPMVTYADEARRFREELSAAVRSLAGVPHRPPAEVGVMVEVPAAALAVEEVAAEVDFVSVGTNDLVQYLAAAERTLPEVAALYRPEATAVWRVLEQLVAGAHGQGCRVAVCGELAADPAFATRLVDLGVDELSVAPASVPAVKAALRAAT